ncbi:MAG TPA: glycoside hydrolase family 130 protein [Sedimentisphaerales bacterium]|nr:glycoside hydrolase family 130 protein [Sedimentisphaerales bacterium]
MVFRSPQNPIIGPKDVKPSRGGFEVIGVFNAGVARFGGEVVLLLRVAERPVATRADAVLTGIYDAKQGDIVVKSFSKNDAESDFSDPRLIIRPNETYLTSISHLRAARSRDGINFEIGGRPALTPANDYETFGIEDARVSLVEGTYYITYVAVCPFGVTTCLASTEDFTSFERHGVIFCPENKDAALFPGKVGGKYYALHRPVSSLFKKQEIWIAESPDLHCWGNHRRLMGPRAGYWDELKVGAGAAPLRTEAGWLEIYHGADRDNRYCLGGVLLEAERPDGIIARSDKPILEPEADYEVGGFFGNVVFSCGLLCEDDKLKIYYGAADTSIAYAEVGVKEVLEELS